MNYLLMNKNNVVMEFKSEVVLASSSYVSTQLVGKLPYGFKDIGNWLEHRQAAKHRQHIKALMEQCGCLSIEGFIRVMHCTSINDTFWVKENTEPVCWEDVSLYSNEFNETISKLAFEGVGLFGEQFSSTSPEFGTAGAYAKCCTKDVSGAMYMLKRGTTGYVNAGLEPYCEVLSSELYSIITQDSVPYGLVTHHGTKASKCEIFTNDAIGLAPYAHVGTESGVRALAFYEKYGSGDKFRNMLVADAICFNEDRHAGNHGVLFDNDTLDILGMSPIYDNNISMLPYAMSTDFDNVNGYLLDHDTRLGDTWVSTARGALTSETRTRLINLRGYEFDFKGDEKFPLARVHVMERLVDQQIKRVLGWSDVVGFVGIRGWDEVASGLQVERAKARLNEGR